MHMEKVCGFVLFDSRPVFKIVAVTLLAILHGLYERLLSERCFLGADD